jgi:geranylgeranyl pyrophosphate synthase
MLGADSERLVTLAAAIELLHTATLVHDDLIDGSLLRRGIPTINAHWSPAATVLTGDFIFSKAAKLAAETDSVPVMNLFARTLTTIVNGEITQMFARKGVITREDYYARIQAKTASLFELAASAAAILSPVNEATVEVACRFGNSIGMAFQIVDDVLDFTGEQRAIGKPVASDLRQGLVTLPVLYYMEMVADDRRLLTLVSGGSLSEKEIGELLNVIRISGASDLAMVEARQFAERGIAELKHLPEGAAQKSLEELVYYIIQRKS